MSSIRAIESQKISLHTHPFMYERKQKSWHLAQSGREVSFLCVPSAHVGIVGNETADFEARQATSGNGVQGTIGCSRFAPNRKAENVG
jgi:hypothetical protein